jgi:transcriptional regulator of arginine metabolism
MADVATHRARREVIRRLLRTQVIATQDELGELLRRDGIEVTQATLSRDLARLKARRVTLPDGGTVYELADAPASRGEGALRGVHTLVTTVDASDAMVVVRTLPGGAPAVAAAIDSTRPPGVLGTLAGDDTIFIVPEKGVKPGRVKRDLLSVWKKEKHHDARQDRSDGWGRPVAAGARVLELVVTRQAAAARRPRWFDGARDDVGTHRRHSKGRRARDSRWPRRAVGT